MSLTSDGLKVTGYFYSLRRSEQERELWSCVEDELFSEAARLMERGWLDRAWREGEILFRMSDEGYVAVELTSPMLGPGAMN